MSYYRFMNIVFAHFHSKIPNYLKLNLEGILGKFPEHETFLITDLNNKHFKLKGLKTIIYQPSLHWMRSEELLSHPRNFRKNFWFTSLARFIAIAEFARTNLGPILHIESDVILSREFPFEVLNAQEELFQFPIVSESLAIASVLYLKNIKAAELLEETTLSEVRSNPLTTDMHILRKLSIKHPGLFRALPSMPSNISAMNSVDEDFLNANAKSIAIYGGIFDGFDIGKYLFGDDPRNHRGFSRLRRNRVDMYLNPGTVKFSMGSGSDFPVVYDQKQKSLIPIYALHIHCKHLGFFKINRSLTRIQKYISDAEKPPRIRFYPKVFIFCLQQYFLRRIKRFVDFLLKIS